MSSTIPPDMTRSKAIRAWLVAVTLIMVAAIAIGVHMTIGIAATLLVLCLVPPLVAIFVWPGIQPTTVSDIVHARHRRL
jgi:hypothetical protein